MLRSATSRALLLLCAALVQLLAALPMRVACNCTVTAGQGDHYDSSCCCNDRPAELSCCGNATDLPKGQGKGDSPCHCGHDEPLPWTPVEPRNDPAPPVALTAAPPIATPQLRNPRSVPSTAIADAPETGPPLHLRYQIFLI